MLRHILSPAECQQLRDIGEKQLSRSEVVHAPGSSGVNSVRTSFGMFITDPAQAAHPANRKLRHTASKALGLSEVNVEATQMLRYLPGQFYRAHPDYFGAGSEHLKRGGERVGTLLVWLNRVENGGQTKFPNALGGAKEAKGEVGDGLMFYSMNEDASTDYHSFHEAAPPGEGSHKWVAVLWVRQHEFH